jgi:C4-type Zn-finger protein
MERNQTIVTLEDILTRFDNQTKKFIQEIEREEENERVETIDVMINDMKGQKNQTLLNKNKFINEIKFGLGEKIKENPTTIIKHTKPWYIKLSNRFKRIFTKF